MRRDELETAIRDELRDKICNILPPGLSGYIMQLIDEYAEEERQEVYEKGFKNGYVQGGIEEYAAWKAGKRGLKK